MMFNFQLCVLFLLLFLISDVTSQATAWATEGQITLPEPQTLPRPRRQAKLGLKEVCTEDSNCTSPFGCLATSRSGKECLFPLGTTGCDGKDDSCQLSAICPYDTCGFPEGITCSAIKDCINTTVCETQDGGDKICKVLPGETCDRKPECSTGTVCVPDTDGSLVCKLVAGKSCTLHAKDCINGTLCNKPEEGTGDRFCKVIPGGACNVTNDCSSGAQCVPSGDGSGDDVCKLKAGQNCTDYTEDCIDGTICESSDGFCKWIPGHSCSSNDTCVSGTLCMASDSNGGIDVCQLKVGENCIFHTEDCISGTVCDISEGVCKLTLGENCAPDTGDCINGTDCDSSGVCKLIEGQNCTDHSEDCIDGTMCDSAVAVCKRSPGQNCSSSDTCMTGTVCAASDIHDGRDVCQLTFGENCTLFIEECVSGTGCDASGFCKNTLGQNCALDNGDCIDGTDCDISGICKLTEGQDCTDHTEECIAGTICDSSDMCKWTPGQNCSSDDTCMTGTVCAASDIHDGRDVCQLLPEQNCTSYTKECVNITECDTFHNVCKLIPGESCTADVNCSREARCVTSDSDDDVCKLKAGSDCSLYSEECVNTTVCDQSDNRCRLILGETCSTSDDICRTGTQCVTSKGEDFCKYTVGEVCSQTEDCVPEAICDDAKKTCRLKPGENCTGDTCRSGASCETSDTEDGDKVCKLTQGQNCTDFTEECINGTICDSSDYTCRQIPGAICTGHDTCTNGTLCVTSHTEHGNKQICKLLHGEDCTLYPGQCIGGMACEPRNGTSGDKICKIVLESGHKCDSTEETACGTNLTCQTVGAESTCKLALPVDHGCNTTDYAPCGENAVCEDATETCVCKSTYYKINTECHAKIGPEKHCNEQMEVNPCVEGAVCHAGLCKCVSPSAKPTETACETRKGHNATGCKSDNDCILFAKCENVTSDEAASTAVTPTDDPVTQCVCDDTISFANGSVCQLRKPIGGTGDDSRCHHDEECPTNAVCDDSSGKCKCEEDFYFSGERCEQRRLVGAQCEPGENDHCLVHGECVNYVCRCKDGHFENDTICSTSIFYGKPCDIYNDDPKQCGNNTQCVYRATDNEPTCACDVNHFFNTQECELRIPALDACYLNFNLPNEKQCVEHAECNMHTHVCECIDGRYYRIGRCPRRLDHGETCDPWIKNALQCMEGFQCIYGKCARDLYDPILG